MYFFFLLQLQIFVWALFFPLFTSLSWVDVRKKEKKKKIPKWPTQNYLLLWKRKAQAYIHYPHYTFHAHLLRTIFDLLGRVTA